MLWQYSEREDTTIRRIYQFLLLGVGGKNIYYKRNETMFSLFSSFRPKLNPVEL